MSKINACSFLIMVIIEIIQTRFLIFFSSNYLYVLEINIYIKLQCWICLILSWNIICSHSFWLTWAEHPSEIFRSHYVWCPSINFKHLNKSLKCTFCHSSAVRLYIYWTSFPELPGPFLTFNIRLFWVKKFSGFFFFLRKGHVFFFSE